jgi:hypothetical protein
LPEIEVAKKLDVGKARDTLQLLDAFRAVRDKVAAFAKDVDNALNNAQASLSVQALDVYNLAQSHARRTTNGALPVWVANMQRDLGRRGPKAPTTPTVPLLPPTSKQAEPRGHAARQ